MTTTIRCSSPIEAIAKQGELRHIMALRHVGWRGSRMSATAYRRLSESIDLHRIDASCIGVPLILVVVDQDALVPAAGIEALAASVPGSRFHLIHSRYGHDAFLKEEAQVAAIITEFLETLEIDR